MARDPKLTSTNWTGLGYDLQKRNFAVTGFQSTILIALVISLIHLKANFSFLGISSDDINSAKELLVIVSAAVGLYGTSLLVQIDYLKEMLDAKSAILAGQSTDAKNVLLLSYGFSGGWDPPLVDKYVAYGRFKKILQGATIGLSYV
jgi:hypothetical protein